MAPSSLGDGSAASIDEAVHPVVREQVEVCVPRGKDSRPGTLVVDAGSRPQSELTVYGWSPQEIIGYLYKQELNIGEVTDEGDFGDGSGCGNGRDEVSGAARATGGVARQPLGRELRRCRCSGSCVGIHRG